ncbi:MAG: ROK family protein, partial [Thermoplasmata archaeon]|nr:ROK family protein [Thermoplasmata archaeon]
MASGGSPGGPRPPTTPPGADLYLGIDIGATKIATALLDGAGRIVATRRSPVPPHPLPTTVVEGIARNAVAELGADRAQIRSIGVGIAAQVRPDTGEVHFAPNLEWRNVPLREMLEAALDRPTFVTNDVRAATFGEWKHGAGVGATELACVWVGTGAGGSVVSAGRLLHGATNTSGEVGHLTIVSGGRRCRCRGTGCLEAYVG